MTRFEVTEDLSSTGRGPWVVGVLRSGEVAAGDVVVVAHTGDRLRVREVAPWSAGTGLRLDRVGAVGPGAVLVGEQDPRPDDATPPVPAPAPVPAPGPVHYEVQVATTITGRGPVLAGLLRCGGVEAGDVLAVRGSGETVRVTSVDLHRRRTPDGVVLGLAVHPDDAHRAREGTVLVSCEGER